MRGEARVVVIGGGVVGCSVLYHLTKLGWRDVVLVERSELTSGSTWHAAGGFHTLNADTNVAALQGYTIRLYAELEAITGLSCGLHHVGGLTLAGDRDRMDFLKAERAKHRVMGLETEIVGPAEIAALSNITRTEGVIGALWDPLDGHLDPSGTTQAYAKAARMAGAEIVLRTPVTATTPRVDGSWDVVTEAGTIRAEHVVNAAGLWAREVGRLAGIELPLHPMEHQYLVTADAPEIYERETEHPHVMDPEGECYLRQEGRGLCIGFYEKNATPWGVGGTPLDFGHELLTDDLDRIGESLAFAYRRFPVLERAGVKRVINGPFTFAPDGNPLVGPVPGLRNYWSATAVMAGFSQGGGVGLTLAQWMIEGETERDVFAMDVARFGPLGAENPQRWTAIPWTRMKAKENYERRFSVSYPNEELPAARPHRTTPAHAIWDAQRAVWGTAYGMEAVNYFAPEGEPRFETPSFRRSNAFEAVGAECRAVREAVGINEVHNFGKYRVEGPGARAWLDRIMAGRIPQPGRMSLTPMLSRKGRIIGDFTVTCLGETRFHLTASYGAQAYHTRWFEAEMGAGVTVETVSDSLIGFQIAGPRARDLLARVTAADVSNAAFPFMTARMLEIGHLEAFVQRVSYTGDLGYEIYVDAREEVALYGILAEAGADLGLRPFGMRAMMSLRLEKGFGSWLREFRPDYMPAETGLDRFVAYNKPAEFIGKGPALAEKAAGPARRLATMTVDALDADCHGDEPIFESGGGGGGDGDGDGTGDGTGDGRPIGFVTSGGFAHHAGRSVAIGFLPTERIAEGAMVSIEILGERRPARVYAKPLFDPEMARMRG